MPCWLSTTSEHLRVMAATAASAATRWACASRCWRGGTGAQQAAPIAVAVVWSFVAEGILISLLPEVGKWGPGGAAMALAGGSSTEGDLLAP